MIQILSAALHVVLRRDMSLNRRLYAWLLGFDNNGCVIGPRSTRHSNPEEHAIYYFNNFSKDPLIQAMVGILQGKRCGKEEKLPLHDLKPFRILISLLDKPELGPAILEDVLIEVFRTLHSQCKAELNLKTQPSYCEDDTQLSSKMRENKKTSELIKTANLLFNSFEPYYMWDYIARWFEECCRITLSARLHTSSHGKETSEYSLPEFCLLVDFLLDIVSLETYIEIQTEHLPQLLLRMISGLTSHLPALCLSELTDCLKLCSKVLSKVQPPLLSPGSECKLHFPGSTSFVQQKEDQKVSSSNLEPSGDVFEDGENPPSSQSSESGFTEFVQYQADKIDDIDKVLGEGQDSGSLPQGSASSETETASTIGSEDTMIPSSTSQEAKVALPVGNSQKTTMQYCLEYFEQFLTQFIRLYIIPNEVTCRAFATGFQMDLCKDRGQTDDCDLRDKGDATFLATEQQQDSKDYHHAFTAACQLFFECSSFPVYIAEGSLASSAHSNKSETDFDQVKPPVWLQTLMTACCFASDFSIQSVAISLVLDLVGLTQSVAAVSGENLNNLESAQPRSPSQGTVAVVIMPPVTQGNLTYITQKTEFFKQVAAILWNQLGDKTPQYYQRSVELFYQLHNLVPSSSICEDVISQQLLHKDKKICMEAHVNFSVLWHITRDLLINKSSSFNRTFDRSLLIMLDSLSSMDGSICSVAQSWLNQCIQRHDIARILEPLLLLLLHPKTQRISVQRMQIERHISKSKNTPVEEDTIDYMQGINGADVFGHLSFDSEKHSAPKEMINKHLGTEEMENFSFTVNPLSDRLSMLSTSSETLPFGVSDFDLQEQQAEVLHSSESGCSQSSTGDNSSYEAEPLSMGSAKTNRNAQIWSECSVDVVVQQVVSHLISSVVNGLNSEFESPEHQAPAQTETCMLGSSENLQPAECSFQSEATSLSTRSHLNGMMKCNSSESMSTSIDAGIGTIFGSLSRPKSSPSVSVPEDPLFKYNLSTEEVQLIKMNPLGNYIGQQGKVIMKQFNRELDFKDFPIPPGAKPKIKINKKKDDDKKKAQNEKMKPPNVSFGDNMDLENWYSCGEGEISEIESDVGSPGIWKTSKFHIHPLYQHVLLYLQVCDSTRALHALSAVESILKTNPAGFVSAISTTSVNNTYTPQLSLLQNLMARHRISVMGRDFYSHIPLDSSHTFRSSMYIEIIISLCLYFMRSYYPAHVKVTQQDLSGNRNLQIVGIQILTLLFTELAKVTESSAKGFASFISDMLLKCKVQKVVLHCLLSSVFSAQKWHYLRTAGKNVMTIEEGLSEDSIINFSEDEIDNCSTLQTQLLKLIQRLIVLEHKVMVASEDSETGYEFVTFDLENSNAQQSLTSLQYLHSQPITSQGMFMSAIIKALNQPFSCKMNAQWIGLITSTLPYMGKVLRTVVTAVTLQLCRNLDNLIHQYKYESGMSNNRPTWMAVSIAPDMFLTLLEGMTTIIHYCLLDPSIQYHQSFLFQHMVTVDQKYLSEARNGILFILRTIVSSVSLLWGILQVVDSTEKTIAASAVTINLGSTKSLRQQILELLGPISMNHGVHFMAAIAFVWNERKENASTSRNKVIPVPCPEQLLLVELVRSISIMRAETVIQTVKEVLKQPPLSTKEKKQVPEEVCMLQFFYAYVQRVLNEFIMKNPNLENKKDQRDLQDITHKIVEAVGTIAGSSLEQTTWLRRNLEVKASPQILVEGNNLERDVEGITLTPVMETSSITPSVYSVHALTLLAEVLAHLLDMVFHSEEKEKVIPLLVNIMYYVVPYLRNHSWRAIIDHLMTHDKTTFRDLMARVAVAQSSSLNLFASREAELEQRAMLLKRLAFAIFSSEVDQYQKYLPDIQERLVESLRLPHVPTLHAQVFLFFRVLLLRMSPRHLTSLWPTMITELVQVFLLIEQELTADEDISRTAGPSVSGLETTYTGGNGVSTSYNNQRWLGLYLSACKFLDLALNLPSENLPQFQMYRWAFIPEISDDSGLEVRRQGTHQREFKPYVVRLAKLLRKRTKKNLEDDNSVRTLEWEPGHLLLTVYSIRSIEQLLPFFNVLSQFFSNKISSRFTGSSGSPVPWTNTFSIKDIKPENQKTFWSKSSQKIEEVLEKDFLEGVIKT
ncbi:protein dopey-1 isoform X8 [Rhincodon typus]|uniref:protein dopey-1 isoform X8 n=1 Tax=Rhincodon typus TaxID=259920 RepID=UPI00202F07BD|nr:protein dopey-1 isoform X8 [Rhincodon typus]